MQGHTAPPENSTAPCGGCDGCGGDCTAARCPICTEPFRAGARPCAHLIAALDAETLVYAPFAIDEGLCLQRGSAARTWRADELRDALGPAAMLLDAYPNGPATPPEAAHLVDAVMARLSFPVERLERGSDRRYYAAKGVIARRQARHLVERLRLGFIRLELLEAAVTSEGQP